MSASNRKEPEWLDSNIAIAIHDRQLAEHGGGQGVRDLTLLESALARPVNRWHYGDDDWANLAAAYAFGVARNHPFVDGNKRTAWVLARLFLLQNERTFIFDKIDATKTMIAFAGGELTEEEMAHWFRQHLAESTSNG